MVWHSSKCSLQCTVYLTGQRVSTAYSSWADVIKAKAKDICTYLCPNSPKRDGNSCWSYRLRTSKAFVPSVFVLCWLLVNTSENKTLENIKHLLKIYTSMNQTTMLLAITHTFHASHPDFCLWKSNYYPVIIPLDSFYFVVMVLVVDCKTLQPLLWFFVYLFGPLQFFTRWD